LYYFVFFAASIAAVFHFISCKNRGLVLLIPDSSQIPTPSLLNLAARCT
jgi:hypothetical protein